MEMAESNNRQPCFTYTIWRPGLSLITLGNVCAVLSRVFSTVVDVQYSGGYHYYYQGIPSILSRDTISAVEVLRTVKVIPKVLVVSLHSNDGIPAQ